MAEPIPGDLGTKEQRQARAMLGRNMLILGTLFGFLMGVGVTLSIVADEPQAGFYVLAVVLLLAGFMFSRRS